jgi:leucyl aminopeptidase
MQLSVSRSEDLSRLENCVLFATEESGPQAGGRRFPAAELIERLRQRGDFAGKAGQSLLLYTPAGADLPEQRLLLIGLGPAAKLSTAAWRRAGVTAVKALGAGAGVASAAFVLPEGADAEAFAVALQLAGYKYDRYISRPEARPKRLAAAAFVPAAGGDGIALEQALVRARRAAEATLFARELANTPGNVMGPVELAGAARDLAAASHARIACRVMGEAELVAGGFRALLAVGQGSKRESQLAVLDYDPGRGGQTVVLVGKGVTFDAGGISIKPAEKMHEMIIDMSGAAAVLGLFKVLPETQLPHRVVGLLPMVENLPGGGAYRPGDIVVARSGLSIEIVNTDAEGRLILADALDYAKEFKPDLLIDLATLTVSCVIGLGFEAAGLMVNEAGARFQEAMIASGERSGERVWPLPMFDEYLEPMKSEVADLKNSGGRYGGALTAAKFLQKFADHSPWMHVDIAGPAYTGKESGLTPKIGTGFGARLLLDFLERF